MVNFANDNRKLFHMADGPMQQERDQLLSHHDWWDEERSFPWVWADLKFSHELFGFDAIKSADDGFARGQFAATRA